MREEEKILRLLMSMFDVILGICIAQPFPGLE